MYIIIYWCFNQLLDVPSFHLSHLICAAQKKFFAWLGLREARVHQLGRSQHVAASDGNVHGFDLEIWGFIVDLYGFMLIYISGWWS